MTSLIHAISEECRTDRIADDVTAKLLAESGQASGIANIFSKQEGVFSGELVVRGFQEVFFRAADFKLLVKEGQFLKVGDSVVEVKATISQLLSLERSLLNYLSHLSGVATLTQKYVSALKNPNIKILATRKTLPGMRELELQAVVAGGGRVHRRSLSDGILIKENHQIFVKGEELLERARKSRSPLHRIEIEIQDLNLLKDILRNPPDVIMLDNLPIHSLKEAVALIRTETKGQTQIEVSGGMTPEAVSCISELDIDFISVGKLTHSAPSLDLSMDLRKI